MKIVLAGEESAGAQTLKLLLASGFDLAAVLTTGPHDGESGEQGQASFGGGAWAAARAAGLTILPADRVADPGFADWVRASGADLLLNVHSLHIVHEDVVQSPRIGCFNLHPGPLPELAGLNSASWAIYEGARGFGVTLHWMEAGIDTGDIAYDSRFPVADSDTALSLNLQCVRKGLELVKNLLTAAATDHRSIPRRPQDLTRRRYRGRGVPNAGKVSWRWPAGQLERFVRACDYAPFPSPWGRPRFRVGETEVEILRARSIPGPAGAAPGTVGNSSNDGVPVACGEGWLEILQVRRAGQSTAAKELLAAAARVEDGR